MLRRKYHICSPEKRIRPRGENCNNAIRIFNFKINLGTFAFADPVALGDFYFFRPVNMIEALQ